MNKKVKIGIIITAAMVVAVSALVIAAHVYYGNRWYANTWIGEHELSGMSYDESEQMLQYFQFPKFLLKLRISQTAKYLYMILYDRARISRMNSWIDKYGNVYLIFPIEELSVQIDKCKSSVKTALKELDDVGLLVRRSGGFSKPNHLYVKIPSDEIGVQPVESKAVEKMAATESEKQPSSSCKNGCAGVGNVAPSKVTEKYKSNKYHEVNYCYGEGESL